VGDGEAIANVRIEAALQDGRVTVRQAVPSSGICPIETAQGRASGHM
jgi:hypothetical protein